MKRASFYFIVFFTLILGCSHLDSYERKMVTKTKAIGNSTELSAIQSVISLVQGINRSSSNIHPCGIADIEYLNRITDAQGGTVLSSSVYIINFKNNAGFAIASADINLPPVLCITDTGSFHAGDELPFGVLAMLSRLDNTTSRNANRSSGPSPWLNFPEDSVNVVWSTIRVENIQGNKIRSRWAQRHRFNNLCPYVGANHAPVGCVPVAVGQIMYYYGKNAVYNNFSYDWSKMRFVVDSNSCPTFLSGWSGVTHLLYALGDSTNLRAKYDSTSTTAPDSLIPRTFTNFGYSNGGVRSNYRYWDQTVEIVHGHPVIVVGYRTQGYATHPDLQVDTFYRNGHAWITDQFLRVLRNVTVYDKTTGEVLYSEDLYQYYLHCNWGWGGAYNGFFLTEEFNYMDSLTMSTKSEIDTTIVEGTSYKYILRQYTGIRP